MLGEIRIDGELATALVKGHPLVRAAKMGKVDVIEAGDDGLVFFDGSFSPAGVGGADLKVWFRVFHESPTVARVQIERLRFGGNEAGADTQVFLVQAALTLGGAFGFELPPGLDVVTKDGKVSITYILPFDFIKPLKIVTVSPVPGKAHGGVGGVFIVRGTGPDVGKLFAYIESLKKAAFEAQNPMAATLKNTAGSGQKNPAPADEKVTPYPAPNLGDGKVKVVL